MAAKLTRSARARKRVPIRFGSTPDETPDSGFTVNVSPRGFALSTHAVHVPGTHLHFSLAIEFHQTARAEGVVVWAQRGLQSARIPGAMGIALTWADEAFFKWISKLVPGSTPFPAPNSQPPAGPLGAAASDPPRTEFGRLGLRQRVVLLDSPPVEKETPFALGGRLPGQYVPLEERFGALITTEIQANLVAVAPSSLSLDVMAELATGDAEEATVPHLVEPSPPPPAEFVGRAPRFFEPLPVRFGVGVLPDTRGFTFNLSRTGLALPALEGVAPGELVVFAISTIDGRVARGAGEVVWSRQDGSDEPSMGVRLTVADRAYLRLIDELTARR